MALGVRFFIVAGGILLLPFILMMIFVGRH